LLEYGIAAAYVKSEHGNAGERVKVKIRDRMVDGEIVKFPFYDSTKYGYARKT